MIAALFHSSNTPPDSLDDPEFGKITVRKNTNARYVRLRMTEDGALSVTLPRFAGERQARDLVESSREQIRQWRAKHVKRATIFNDGDRIGRSHTVRFAPSERSTIRVSSRDTVLRVEYPNTLFHTDPSVQKALKPHIDKALQKEARAYLPRRLSYLAETHGFSYAHIRYGTQKGRWGSCSSKGTISLNVGLMLLEPELIDYVLVHELCHTRQMNHSPRFWSLVESIVPDYKLRRRRLKQAKPTV